MLFGGNQNVAQAIKLAHSMSSRGFGLSRVLLQTSKVQYWHSLSETNIQLIYFEYKNQGTLNLKDGKNDKDTTLKSRTMASSFKENSLGRRGKGTQGRRKHGPV